MWDQDVQNREELSLILWESRLLKGLGNPIRDIQPHCIDHTIQAFVVSAAHSRLLFKRVTEQAIVTWVIQSWYNGPFLHHSIMPSLQA